MRKWQLTYRAVGRDGLLKMGKKHARYDFETKVAAARAVVEGGMSKPGAMERFGIASSSPLDRWCRLYREGGAEALRPKPKGRLLMFTKKWSEGGGTGNPYQTMRLGGLRVHP